MMSINTCDRVHLGIYLFNLGQLIDIVTDILQNNYAWFEEKVLNSGPIYFTNPLQLIKNQS